LPSSVFQVCQRCDYRELQAEESNSKEGKERENEVTSNASKAARKLLDLLGANQKLKAMVARLEDDLMVAMEDVSAAQERATEAEGLVEKAEAVGTRT